MSYETRIKGRPQSLGDVTGDTVATVLRYASKIPQYAKTIAEVIDDPYLPETACRIDQIYDARHKYPIVPCAPTVVPPGVNPTGGVGLRYAQPALKYVAYATRHAWVYPATLVALIGLPFLIGLRLGESPRGS